MKTKSRRRHQGLPNGMTYAEKLAYHKAKERAIQNVAESTLLRVHSNRHAQRVFWLFLVAMAESLGVGPKRVQAFIDKVEELSAEIEQMKQEVDEEYAFEKLRLRAEAVAGEELEYLYEKEAVAIARKKRDGGRAGDP